MPHPLTQVPSVQPTCTPNVGSVGTSGAPWKQKPNQNGIIWVTHHCLRDSSCSDFSKKNFIFGRSGSLLLALVALVLSLVAASRGYSSLRCTGFSLQWLSCCGPKALGTWASVAAVHRLGSCGSRCSEACGIFPDQGLNHVSPALAGGFLSTTPPGKSLL